RRRHFIEVRASKQRRRTFMRLISYGAFGAERAGIEVDGSIVDLEEAMQAAEAEKPVSDIRLFLEQPEWRALTDRCFAARGKVKRIDLASIRLGAPVPGRPSAGRASVGPTMDTSVPPARIRPADRFWMSPPMASNTRSTPPASSRASLSRSTNSCAPKSS